MADQERRYTDQGQEPDPTKDILGALKRKLREGDNFVARSPAKPDFVSAVESASKTFQLRTQTATENTGASGAKAESTEQVPELQRFKADYDKLRTNMKAKCPWDKAQAKLLANDGEKLKLAQAMEQGGILFGVDKNGKLLFADKGDEPIMKGMNYPDTRNRVLYKHTSLNKEGRPVLNDKGENIATGYEMFPFVDPYSKSDEILQYESRTGKPFVKSTNGKERRYSWLESGENPSWPCCIGFNPNYNHARVVPEVTQYKDRDCGVRRLLRV